jgi:hypothetical protein
MALNPQLQHLQDLFLQTGKSSDGSMQGRMGAEGEEEWPTSPSDDNFKVGGWGVRRRRGAQCPRGRAGVPVIAAACRALWLHGARRE